MPKISYILSTNRDLSFSTLALQTVISLPAHDREIIICCPPSAVKEEYLATLNDNRIRIVEDDQCTGSIYSFNKAYKATDGDYISLMVDDIGYPTNFLDILPFMESEFIKKKRFKISNILWDGGPGLITYGHDELEDGTSYWGTDAYHPVDVKNCPYAVIPLPFFSRATIEKELCGHIFNPLFRHHYCDSWLGFFCCKQETYEPFKWRCPTLKYINLKQVARTDRRQDLHDFAVLKKLSDEFVKGTSKYV